MAEQGKVQGEALSEDKLKELQKNGNLPMNIDMSMNPAILKVKSANEDVIVLMIDAPPCGCRKIGKGKKERCRIHRKEKRAKKAKKSKAKEVEVKAEPKKEAGLVKDDESDRKKLGALRHVEDSEEEHDYVDGAISPSKENNALVRCVIVKDGGVQFVQTKGQAVGSGDQGTLIPTIKDSGPARPQEVKSVAFGGGNYGGSVFAMSQAKPVAGSAKPGTPVQPKGVMNGSTPVAAGKRKGWGKLYGRKIPIPPPYNFPQPIPGSGTPVVMPRKGRVSYWTASGLLPPSTGAAAPMQYTVTNKATGSSGGAGSSSGMGAAAGLGTGASMSYHMTSAKKAGAANQPTKMEVKSTSVTNNNAALEAYEARSQFIGK